LRAEPFGPPLCLKRQMLPFALELHRGDRDPGIGGAPVRGLQRPPGLGPADQGAVPRGDLLPDPVDVLFVAVGFLGPEGVGILVVPIGVDPRCRIDGSRNAQRHR
jgi:hypothetical protein